MEDRTWELLMERLDKIDQNIERGFKITNGRLLSLERWRWLLTGAGIAVSGIFGVKLFIF